MPQRPSDITQERLSRRQQRNSLVHAIVSGPREDLSKVLEPLAAKLFYNDQSLAQYVVWSIRTKLLECLSDAPVDVAEVLERSQLNLRGADALLGVLCAAGLATCSEGMYYALTPAASEYLVRTSPFYVGDHLYGARRPIPSEYLSAGGGAQRPPPEFGTLRRLINQHVRNLPACTDAASLGTFAHTRLLLDVGGGSGAFAIPFALRHPEARVVLSELPAAIKNVKRFLKPFELDQRISLLEMDFLKFPWRVPQADAIFLGNIIHGFDDGTSIRICREAYTSLEPGGQIHVHEMIWAPDRQGPLVTALWNATMRRGNGKQRTQAEISAILLAAGFENITASPTSAGFWLLSGATAR